MRLFIIMAAGAALAACTADEPGPAEFANDVATDGGKEGFEVAPIPPGAGAAPAGPTPEALAQCGADQYQWLVGEPRSRIPEEPEGATWRVACTTCPVTMDYSPARMNIFYDEETQRIEEVKCG